MKKVRGRLVNDIRQFLLSDPNREASIRATLSVFGIVFYDHFKDDFFARRSSLECPRVILTENPNTIVPKINFLLPHAPPSPLHKTIKDWMDDNGSTTDPQIEGNRVLSRSWLQALEVILHFVPSSLLLPEEQYRSKLWAPLLEAFLFQQIDDEVRSGPEFKMRTVPAYLGVDARADYACWFEVNDFQIVPVVLEAMPNRTSNAARLHKDLAKIAIEMEACLLSNLAHLNHHAGTHLVFGLLTSGPQLRVCTLLGTCMETEDGSLDWTFVFQAPDEWFLDLASSDPLPDLPRPRVERNSCFEINPGYLLPPPDIEASSLDFETNFSVNLGASDPKEDWPASGVVVNECQPSSLPANLLIPRLKRLKTFCDAIITQIRAMKDLYAPEKLSSRDPSFKLPKRLQKHLPRSTPSSKGSKDNTGPSLVQNTPSKSGSTYKGTRSGGVVSALDQAEAYGVSNHLSPSKPTIVKKNVAIIPCSSSLSDFETRCLLIKPFVLQELESLKRLRNADNIVRLYDWRSLAQSLVMYHLDFLGLATDYLDFSKFEDSLWYGMRMVEDGLSALCSLRKAWILHRDISPGNFLFCPVDMRWKITDFDLAIRLYSSNDDSFIDTQVVGTPEFIAPESKELMQYSYASDTYAMGMTLQELLLPPMFTSVTHSRNDLTVLFEKAYQISAVMSHPNPQLRLIPETGLTEIRCLIEETRALLESGRLDANDD